MSQQLELAREEGPAQPSAFQPLPTTTMVRPRESKQIRAARRGLISILVLLFGAALLTRGVVIRISEITISLGR